MTNFSTAGSVFMAGAGSGIRMMPRVSRMAIMAAGVAATVLASGCASQGAHPDKLAHAAQAAIAKGDTPRSIALTEQAVQADGRNPALRLLLANAYLRAGRFESARVAYGDAIDLGDDSARAALGLVLTDLALGKNAAALDTLNTYGDVLNPADLGLALVMAGQNQRGQAVLINAIRQGQNTPKMRQNLAYAYALSGMWSDARIMAGQDIPADQVDARLQAWATMARPDDGRRRIASLLGAPLIGDRGQPEALALAHFAPVGATGVNAQSAVAAPAIPDRSAPQVQTAATELPPVAQNVPVQATLAQAGTAPRAQIDLRPVVVPAANPVAIPARRPVLSIVHGLGTHLVQIGAYNSDEAARRAWQHFVMRHPVMAGHPDLVTKVRVNGHDFWRLQAAGFAGQAAAASACGSVRAHGGTCFVLALGAAARVDDIQTANAVAGPRPQVQSGLIRPALARPVATRPAPARPVFARVAMLSSGISAWMGLAPPNHTQ